jgi:hypothetical protein
LKKFIFIILLGTSPLTFSDEIKQAMQDLQTAQDRPLSKEASTIINAVFFELWISKVSEFNIEEINTLEESYNKIKPAFDVEDLKQRTRGQLALYDTLLKNLNDATKVNGAFEIKDIDHKIKLLSFGRSVLLNQFADIEKTALTSKQLSTLKLLQTFNLSDQLACAVPLLLDQYFESKAEQYIKSKLNPSLLEEIRYGYVDQTN